MIFSFARCFVQGNTGGGWKARVRVSRERENFGALSYPRHEQARKRGSGARREGAKIPRDINRFAGRTSKGRSTNRLADEAVLEQKRAVSREQNHAAPREKLGARRGK